MTPTEIVSVKSRREWLFGKKITEVEVLARVKDGESATVNVKGKFVNIRAQAKHSGHHIAIGDNVELAQIAKSRATTSPTDDTGLLKSLGVKGLSARWVSDK